MNKLALLFFAIAALALCSLDSLSISIKKRKPKRKAFRRDCYQASEEVNTSKPPQGGTGVIRALHSTKRKHGVRDEPTKPAPVNPPKGHR